MTVLKDPEIFELLHDEPELLAIADAIAATQRPRRRIPRLALAPAVAVAAVVALLLVAPWQTHGPSVVDRALAAVGSGPVLHAVVEYSWPQDVVVDLATGAERQRIHRFELWYDEERRLLFERSSVDGSEPVEHLARDFALEYLDPALGGFTSGYREALKEGRVRVEGDRMVFDPREGGAVQTVVIDPKTGEPLRFQERYPGGRRSPVWRVVAIESVPRRPEIFQEPAGAREVAGEISEERTVSLADARHALGGAIVVLPGREPQDITLSDTRLELSDGRSFVGSLVRLDYGDVKLHLERDPARAVARMDEDVFPIVPDGYVVLRGTDREGWQTELVERGLAVRILADRKERVLAAARALVSRPRP